jgi:hypothetical protein
VISGKIVFIVKPKLWNGGKNESIISLLSRGKRWSDHLISEMRFLCVSATAFGKLSLQDVNKITAVSFNLRFFRGNFDFSSQIIFSGRLIFFNQSSRKTILSNCHSTDSFLIFS